MRLSSKLTNYTGKWMKTEFGNADIPVRVYFFHTRTRMSAFRSGFLAKFFLGLFGTQRAE